MFKQALMTYTLTAWSSVRLMREASLGWHFGRRVMAAAIIADGC